MAPVVNTLPEVVKTYLLHMWLQVLLLDELTTFLDSTDQQKVLQAVRNIVDTASPAVTALWV